MFDLKAPCSECPFKRDNAGMFEFSEARINEIVSAVAFQCHKTIQYDAPYGVKIKKPQQCAGLMALLHAEGKPNQIMQVAERLEGFDASKISTNNTFKTVREAIKAHTGSQKLTEGEHNGDSNGNT